MFRDFFLDFLLNGKRYTFRRNNCLPALIKNRSSTWKTTWWQAKMYPLVSIHHWNWQKNLKYIWRLTEKTGIRANYTMQMGYTGNKNIDVSNISWLIVVARICFNNEINQELLYLWATKESYIGKDTFLIINSFFK